MGQIEICSPGGMYDETFVQDLDPYNVSSVRRNPDIADVFSRMNLTERIGSGLRKIIESYEAEENYEERFSPKFRYTETSFHIVLLNLNYEGQNENKDVGLTNTQKQVFQFFEENLYMTALELAKKVKVSSRTIEIAFSSLQEKKLLTRVGSKKDGYWKKLSSYFQLELGLERAK